MANDLTKQFEYTVNTGTPSTPATPYIAGRWVYTKKLRFVPLGYNVFVSGEKEFDRLKPFALVGSNDEASAVIDGSVVFGDFHVAKNKVQTLNDSGNADEDLFIVVPDCKVAEESVTYNVLDHCREAANQINSSGTQIVIANINKPDLPNIVRSVLARAQAETTTFKRFWKHGVINGAQSPAFSLAEFNVSYSEGNTQLYTYQPSDNSVTQHGILGYAHFAQNSTHAPFRVGMLEVMVYACKYMPTEYQLLKSIAQNADVYTGVMVSGQEKWVVNIGNLGQPWLPTGVLAGVPFTPYIDAATTPDGTTLITTENPTFNAVVSMPELNGSAVSQLPMTSNGDIDFALIEETAAASCPTETAERKEKKRVHASLIQGTGSVYESLAAMCSSTTHAMSYGGESFAVKYTIHKKWVPPIEATPAIHGVPTTITQNYFLGWNAGANFEEPIISGRVEFSISPSANGVVAGLAINNTTTELNDVIYGFLIDNNRVATIIEGAIEWVTGSVADNGFGRVEGHPHRFVIERSMSQVELRVNDIVIKNTPDRIAATQTVLDVSIFTGGDKVSSPVVVHYPAPIECAHVLPNIQGVASDTQDISSGLIPNLTGKAYSDFQTDIASGALPYISSQSILIPISQGGTHVADMPFIRGKASYTGEVHYSGNFFNGSFSEFRLPSIQGHSAEQGVNSGEGRLPTIQGASQLVSVANNLSIGVHNRSLPAIIGKSLDVQGVPQHVLPPIYGNSSEYTTENVAYGVLPFLTGSASTGGQQRGVLPAIMVTHDFGSVSYLPLPPTSGNAFLPYMRSTSVLSDFSANIHNAVLPFIRGISSDVVLQGYAAAQIMPSIQSQSNLQSQNNDITLTAELYRGGASGVLHRFDNVVLVVSQGVVLTSFVVGYDAHIVLQSSANVHTEFITKSQFHKVITSILEQAEISTNEIDSETGYETWVINLRTGAISRYDEFGFNSFAHTRTDTLAANENGLFILGGKTDDGADIKSNVDFGTLPLNSRQLKHVSNVYLLGMSDKALQLKVEVNDGESYTYTARNSSRFKGMQRVDLGKGLRATYYQLELQSDSADYELDGVDVYTAHTSRRI